MTSLYEQIEREVFVEEFTKACVRGDTRFFEHHAQRWFSTMEQLAVSTRHGGAFKIWRNALAPAPIDEGENKGSAAGMEGSVEGTSAQTFKSPSRSPQPAASPLCSVCGDSSKVALKCTECKRLGLEGRGAYFCGRDCQKKAWTYHKLFHKSEAKKLHARDVRMHDAGLERISSIERVAASVSTDPP